MEYYNIHISLHAHFVCEEEVFLEIWYKLMASKLKKYSIWNNEDESI